MSYVDLLRLLPFYSTNNENVIVVTTSVNGITRNPLPVNFPRHHSLLSIQTPDVKMSSGKMGAGSPRSSPPTPPPLPPPPLKSSKERASPSRVKSNGNKKARKVKKNESNDSMNQSSGSDRSLNQKSPKSRSAKPKREGNGEQNKLERIKDIIYSGATEEDEGRNSKNRNRSHLKHREGASNKARISINQGEYVDPVPVLNDVPLYDEDKCQGEDEFTFPCCLMPNSPRYPANPRPTRNWDPAVLPTNTEIPTAIGQNCRRCGKPVYVAELYLSSRGCYHAECFKCCLCNKTLDSWSMQEYKGEIFCKGCYRRNFSIHGVGFGVGAGALQTP